MLDLAPTFPPLLSGHGIAEENEPFDHACDMAQSGELSAGDLVWSKTKNHLRFALVMEPEIERARCAEMVYVAMVAFSDAAGALIPPEVAITFQWPNVIQMNDGQIGSVDLVISEQEVDGIPEWMVLNLDVEMMPDFADQNPGDNYHQTTLWDEGCGEITRTELLESTSRHLINGIHNWSEDGFKPVHKHWLGRLNKEQSLSRKSHFEDKKFIGIDEVGDGLLVSNGETKSHPLAGVLNVLRKKSADA